MTIIWAIALGGIFLADLLLTWLLMARIYRRYIINPRIDVYYHWHIRIAQDNDGRMRLTMQNCDCWIGETHWNKYPLDMNEL